MQKLLCRTLILVVGARPGLWCSLLVVAVAVVAEGAPVEKPTLRLGPKPADAVPERRARLQPTVPEGARELPFVETAPGPALTDLEKERGYLLFQRPCTDCIYPNTHPLPDERMDSLVAFATPGEFEPVTFALYSVRPLQNLKVRVSSLTSSAGEIPAGSIDVRLATYWNVGYPAYTTLSTYRRAPELLERVTVHSSPAGECQWYWLTVHVPEATKPGLYRGTVRVWDDGFGQAIEIPLALRVLGFRLQKDPRKHLSAYFYTRNKALYRDRDEAFVRRAADKDYQAMLDFGLDVLPTLYLRCEDGKHITLADVGELDRMLAAGLKGPAPVTADNVIARIYRDTTPGGNRGNHWRVSPLPLTAFYARVTELFREFEVERKEKGWPEFIFSEQDYRHGTRLVFDVGEISLLRLTSSALAGMDAPRHVLLPRKTLAFAFDVVGVDSVTGGNYTVAAALEAGTGSVRAQARQDLADPHRVALSLSAAEPGACTLRLTLLDTAGNKCSEIAQPVTMHAGPLY